MCTWVDAFLKVWLYLAQGDANMDLKTKMHKVSVSFA